MAEKKFGRAFYVFDSVYVQSTGKGLLKIAGDALVPISGGERFAAENINAAVGTADRALIASDTHLYRLTRAGVAKFPHSAEADLAKTRIYSMGLLPGGEVAVGTFNSGLLLFRLGGNCRPGDFCGVG